MTRIILSEGDVGGSDGGLGLVKHGLGGIGGGVCLLHGVLHGVLHGLDRRGWGEVSH